MKTSILVLSTLLLASRITAAAQTRDRLFPPGSGIVNVLDYGATADGVTDDTQAIRVAMLSRKRDYNKPLIVYFPAGVYLVSDTLEWRNQDQTFFPYITFQGQNSATTMIKLRDRAPGFDNVQAPKALISTDSSAVSPSPIGEGNEAYRNNLYDLTILTGSGNPGAIGIDYLANNRGSIMGVVIRSGDGAGHAGISMTRHWPGPCLIKNVQIAGFDFGIDVNRYEYGITLEHVAVNNQQVAGVRLNNNTIFARDLSSTNDVVAVRITSPSSLMILLDSHFTGLADGSSSLPAIDNAGVLFARNLTVSGYQAAINDHGTLFRGDTIGEYASIPVLRPFALSDASLGLPIAETPETFYDDPADWASVTAYGASPDNDTFDSGPAIQAAIDSGKGTIYFPEGAYYVRDTIRIRGSVHTIVGMESYLWTGKGFKGDGRPVVRFEGGSADEVTIENLAIRSDANVAALEHAGAHTLVLKHVLLAGLVADYRNTADGTGPLFIEDAQIGKMRIASPQSVWARQLNAESSAAFSEPKIINDGGTLWIGGIKTEQGNTVIETRNGGQTELLGGLFYPAERVQTSTPALINRASSVWAVYSTSAYTNTSDYPIQVSEIRAGQTRNVIKADVLRRGQGSIVLYSGYPPVDTSDLMDRPTTGKRAAQRRPAKTDPRKKFMVSLQ